ncbi:MAG TPA: hypothetical protein VH186_30240 [Chloroflexia bacterium]|nr:hypothetical protein [Chloroflexia bacterium]
MTFKSRENISGDKDISGEVYLLPLAAADLAGFSSRLAKLRAALDSGQSLPDLARQYYARYLNEKSFPYVLSLIGHNSAELLRELEKASSALATSFVKGREWQSPNGSYFTPQPLGERGEIAFVYPGAFNSYIGLGQELFERFPKVYERFSQKCSNPDLALGEHLLRSRSSQRFSKEESARLEARLAEDAGGMILSGSGFATLFTTLMREYFGLKPAAAFGYSLGETSMLWATEAWNDIDRGVEAISQSPLFRSRLTGPKETIREQWHVPANEQDEAFWSTYFILAPVDKLKEALLAEKKVFLTQVNTGEEAVISGDSEGCRRVIERLKCHFLRRVPSSVLHCEPARQEYNDFLKIHSYPTREVPGVHFYSAADYSLLKLDQAELAHKLSTMACQTVDFPRLVERVYRDGARLFIELGPGNTCTRWINKILKDKTHMAANISQKGVGDYLTLVRLLAKLVSHRVPLNLAQLYQEEDGKSQYHTVVLNPSLEKMHANATKLAEVQATFLDMRKEGLGQLRELIGASMSLMGQQSSSAPVKVANRVALPPETTIIPQALPLKTQVAKKFPRPLFDEGQIEEFATGSVSKCFGPKFAACEGRRVPRIPNGDLKLMSRITSITDSGSGFEGISSIVAEYDVPENPWFYSQNTYPYTPYSIYMEIALQPCGFLSAYKGSFLLFPGKDLYFRNLDGQANLVKDLDLRGKTVVTKARLLSTAVFEGTIIQRFEFECSCEETVLYRGSSAFGFFTREAMLKQVGLDSGKEVAPWLEQSKLKATRLDLTSPALRSLYYQPSSGSKRYYRLATGQLDLLDEVVLLPGGGRNGKGYIYASRAINPSDWFYKCHFYQDAVMPGSLGIEAILQAMQAYALEQNLAGHLKSPRFGQLNNHAFTWKYRGQITPDNQKMSLEVHIDRVEIGDKQVVVTGEASLWKDQLRIYEVKPVALAIYEAQVTRDSNSR